jgi:hypothetical protein
MLLIATGIGNRPGRPAMNTGGIAGADAFAATIGTSHNKIPVSEAEGSQAVAILATAVGRPVRPPRSQCLMGLMLTPRQEGTTTQSNSTGASRSRGAAASFCDRMTSAADRPVDGDVGIVPAHGCVVRPSNSAATPSTAPRCRPPASGTHGRNRPARRAAGGCRATARRRTSAKTSVTSGADRPRRRICVPGCSAPAWPAPRARSGNGSPARCRRAFDQE